MKTEATNEDLFKHCSPDTLQFRIYTFGLFHIDWVDPSTGHIFPLPPERLQGQNAGSALSVLKALLSCPDRFATRSWLLEQFWPTSRQHSAQERLSDVVSSLRGLLRPPGSKAMLVHYIHGAEGAGAGYRLEGYPHVWCDAHAFEWYVQHASLLDQRGQDSTFCWNRAFQLKERGIYLPEYLYDDWACKRREMLDSLGRDCIQRWTVRLRQMGHVDEAMMRLRSYWLNHRTDEDVLRPLVEMLGERERFQEAEECYAKTQEALEEDGHEPSQRTRETLEVVRALKVQRSSSSIGSNTTTSVPHVAHSCSVLSSEDIIQEPFHQVCSPSTGRSMEQSSATWFHLKQQLIQLLVRQWQGRATYCDELQGIVDQELHMSDSIKSLYQQEAYIVSRRSMLAALALLPLTLQTSWPQQLVQPPHPETFLPECTASITSCWHLLNGDGLAAIEQTLPVYLPTLVTWSKQPSRYQQTAASLAAQGSIIMRLVTYHQFRLQDSLAYTNQAVELAKISGDHDLLAYALTSAGFASYWTNQPQLMLQRYQEAECILQKVTPAFQSSILAGLAHAYAQNSCIIEAQDTLGKARDLFSEKVSEVPCYISAHAGLSQLIINEGLTHLALGSKDANQALTHYNNAKNALALINRQFPDNMIPQRNYAQIVNYQAQAAIGMGDLDEAEHYLLAGMRGATALGSEKRRQEVLVNWDTAKKRWPYEKKLLALAEGMPS